MADIGSVHRGRHPLPLKQDIPHYQDFTGHKPAEAFSGISAGYSGGRVWEQLEYLRCFLAHLSRNIFYNVRNYYGYTQERMAAMVRMRKPRMRCHPCTVNCTPLKCAAGFLAVNCRMSTAYWRHKSHEYIHEQGCSADIQLFRYRKQSLRFGVGTFLSWLCIGNDGGTD